MLYTNRIHLYVCVNDHEREQAIWGCVCHFPFVFATFLIRASYMSRGSIMYSNKQIISSSFRSIVFFSHGFSILEDHKHIFVCSITHDLLPDCFDCVKNAVIKGYTRWTLRETQNVVHSMGNRICLF